MESIGYVFIGVFLSKVLGHLLRRIDINEVAGYLLTGIILGALLGNDKYISDLSLVSSIAAIFVVFYAGITSDFETIIENIWSAVVISLVSVVVSFTTTIIVVAYMGYPIIVAVIVALLLSNTATETAAMLIRGLPVHVRSILVSASFLDDLFLLFSTSIYYTWRQTSSINNVLIPLLASISLTLTIFILMAKYKGILYPVFKYISREIAYLTDFALITLSILILVSTRTNVSPLIASYLAGVLLSGGRTIYDPMLRYKTRISDFISIMGNVIDSLFTPIFMLYVGLYMRTASIDTTLYIVLLLVAVTTKFTVYTVFFKLKGEETNVSLYAGISMTGRGVLEITLLVKALEAGLITASVFNTVVAMALSTIVFSILASTIIMRRID